MGLGVLETKSHGSVPDTILLVETDSHADNAAGLTQAKGTKECIILSPQPSDNPNDPLIDDCILFNHSTDVHRPVHILCRHRKIGRISSSHAGATGLCVAATARKYGKRPMYIGCSVISLAGRILRGIRMTPYERVIMATIGDLFFVHEHGPRVAIVLFVISSLTNLILTVLFELETACKRNYDRAPSRSSQRRSQIHIIQHPGTADDGEKNKTAIVHIVSAAPVEFLATSPQRKPFIQRLSLSNGTMISDSIWKMVDACAVTLTNIGVSFTIFVSSVVMAWLVVVGVLSAIIFSAPPYNLRPAGIGYISVGSLVGGILGHFFMKFRLACVIIGTISTISGLVGFRYVLEAKGNLYLVCFPWGVQVFGIIMVMAATTAYALDTIFLMNMVAKNFLFYGHSNFIVKWFNAVGPARMFDSMAGITAISCTLTIPMYVLGKRYRDVWVRHDVIQMLRLETNKEGTSSGL
ncbi:hypothetical protein K469DRAFT_741307 [Zopfia rhizophila CBS 207.26]|uniref:DUF4203 domain-containing protein n=1 Tax=Zopfia rhizophila CBS 207.26 TaxID=1314779 RepID=A0A6A6DRQ1_9PEZI|nr:hypothetical protein K469DRAFT_741307 [Zopfia rhizophila CBS 207.26]